MKRIIKSYYTKNDKGEFAQLGFDIQDVNSQQVKYFTTVDLLKNVELIKQIAGFDRLTRAVVVYGNNVIIPTIVTKDLVLLGNLNTVFPTQTEIVDFDPNKVGAMISTAVNYASTLPRNVFIDYNQVKLKTGDNPTNQQPTQPAPSSTNTPQVNSNTSAPTTPKESEVVVTPSKRISEHNGVPTSKRNSTISSKVVETSTKETPTKEEPKVKEVTTKETSTKKEPKVKETSTPKIENLEFDNDKKVEDNSKTEPTKETPKSENIQKVVEETKSENITSSSNVVGVEIITKIEQPQEIDQSCSEILCNINCRTTEVGISNLYTELHSGSTTEYLPSYLNNPEIVKTISFYKFLKMAKNITDYGYKYWITHIIKYLTSLEYPLSSHIPNEEVKTAFRNAMILFAAEDSKTNNYDLNQFLTLIDNIYQQQTNNFDIHIYALDDMFKHPIPFKTEIHSNNLKYLKCCFTNDGITFEDFYGKKYSTKEVLEAINNEDLENVKLSELEIETIVVAETLENKDNYSPIAVITKTKENNYFIFPAILTEDLISTLPSQLKDKYSKVENTSIDSKDLYTINITDNDSISQIGNIQTVSEIEDYSYVLSNLEDMYNPINPSMIATNIENINNLYCEIFK